MPAACLETREEALLALAKSWMPRLPCDLDVLIANVNGLPALLENRGGSTNHWLTVALRGSKSNRNGIGARVAVRAGNLSLVEEVRSGGSYLSQSDLRAHFGLGTTAAVTSLEIRWPGGHVDRFTDVPVDRVILVKEGDRTYTARPERRGGSSRGEQR